MHISKMISGGIVRITSLLCVMLVTVLASAQGGYDNRFGQMSVKNGYVNDVGYKYDDYKFYESNLVKCIRRQIYGSAMLRKIAFYSGRQVEYMPHSFALMMKMPDYPDIAYRSQYATRAKVEEYNRLMSSQVVSCSYCDMLNLKSRPINEAISKAAFYHPEKVEYLWAEVPDVSQVGKSKLNRKAVDRTISTLLRDTFDTKPSLERLVIRKSPWKYRGTENIQLTQGFLENWAKGGNNSVSLSSDLRFSANFNRGNHSWENNIVHKIGVLSVQDERAKVNNDLIEVNTKYGLKSSKKWYYSFLYNFKTQFFYGYGKNDKDHETPISGFFAPAYMSFALGMDFKPSSNFTLLLSPLTSRLTIVSDTVKFDQTKYGIKDDKKVKSFNGFSVVNMFSQRISKEVNLTSKTDIFYQYLSSEEDKQVQILWELIMDMRINQFLSTRLLCNLRYFTNESDKVQFKENFNIAFQYHF